MYWVGLVTAFFWGIGQSLPYENWYIHGISIGDGIFLLYLSFALATGGHLEGVLQSILRIRAYSFLTVVFMILSLLSATINAYYWDIYFKDVIESLRILYYLIIVGFVSVWVERYGPSHFLIAFLFGILFSGFVNYYYVSSQEWATIYGFVVLYKPNIIGNLVGIGILMVSFLVYQGRYAISALLFLSFLFLSVFTYSKGTWLMVGLGTMANLVVYLKSEITTRRAVRIPYLLYSVSIFSIPILGFIFYSELGGLIKFKLETTQFSDTAEAGGTFAARLGFVLASFRMLLDNPVLGVGISNYEQAYDQMKDFLGPYYWPTDTPHSAFLYVLACMGLPAFIIFMLLFVYPFTFLRKILSIKGILKYVYLFLAFSVFILSGSIQPQLLTQYFFWIFTGMVIGWDWYLKKKEAQSPSIP